MKERILDALNAGCSTSREIAEFTGIELYKCTPTLDRLLKLGAVRKGERVAMSYPGRVKQQPFYKWEVVK